MCWVGWDAASERLRKPHGTSKKHWSYTRLVQGFLHGTVACSIMDSCTRPWCAADEYTLLVSIFLYFTNENCIFRLALRSGTLELFAVAGGLRNR